ncbi:MAG: hypothetical protein PHS54_04140 [Clostridia bacterium]|nr:hypothetical protein [Clostridia bacterium]
MFLISKEQRDALIQYISKRPLEEVINGYYMLSNLEEINEETLSNLRKEEKKYETERTLQITPEEKEINNNN